MSSIVIIDDHPPLREGLKAIISRDNSFKVIGEAGTAEDALQVIGREEPDIAITDISLPDSSGIELTKQFHRQFPNMQVLIVSMHVQQEYIVAAFEAGATGYVTKEATAERLIDALRVVEDGELFIDHVCTKVLIDRLLRVGGMAGKRAASLHGELTTREYEVLSLLAEGCSSKEIGNRLMISEKTASNHRSHLLQKLGFSNVVELVRYAEKNGLIE